MNKRTLNRMQSAIKKFDKVVTTLREHDVSEADTVVAVNDMLADIFGFDKYLELTGEYQIRGTYCDIAVKIDNKVRYLIEVKAANIKLSSKHIKQAVDYGANEGIDWVVLTNGTEWHIYRITFTKPIDHEEIAVFNINDIDMRKEEDQRKVYLLSREALNVGAMEQYHEQAQKFNPYTIAYLITQEKVLNSIRLEFKRIFGNKITNDEITKIIKEEIVKRDIVDGDKAKEVSSKIRRINNKLAKLKEKKPVPEPESQPI